MNASLSLHRASRALADQGVAILVKGGAQLVGLIAVFVIDNWSRNRGSVVAERFDYQRLLDRGLQ